MAQDAASLTPLDPTRTVRLPNHGRPGRQAWQHHSADGVWRYDRHDDVNTYWTVTHLRTGAEEPTWFGTLTRARRWTARQGAGQAVPV